MSGDFQQHTAEAHPNEIENGIDDRFVEAIWHELDGQLPRARVHSVVSEIALRFQDATVKTFLPILVHRRAIQRLREEINKLPPQITV